MRTSWVDPTVVRFVEELSFDRFDVRMNDDQLLQKSPRRQQIIFATEIKRKNDFDVKF